MPVTVRYIQEVDVGFTFPKTAEYDALKQAALASGAMVSFNRTNLGDPANVVMGKDRQEITFVFRSEADRQQWLTDLTALMNANPELRNFIDTHTTKVDLTITNS